MVEKHRASPARVPPLFFKVSETDPKTPMSFKDCTITDLLCGGQYAAGPPWAEGKAHRTTGGPVVTVS